MDLITEISHDVDANYDEVEALCKTWWADTPFHKKLKIEFNPNRELFDAMGKSESVFGIFIRDADTRQLLGCFIGLIQPFLFNKDMRQVQEIVWCVDKSFRGRKIAVKLMKEVHKYVEMKGIDLTTLSTPATCFGDTIISAFVRSIGYTRVDSIYFKNMNQ